jgi:hypothetical protein
VGAYRLLTAGYSPRLPSRKTGVRTQGNGVNENPAGLNQQHVWGAVLIGVGNLFSRLHGFWLLSVVWLFRSTVLFVTTEALKRR